MICIQNRILEGIREALFMKREVEEKLTRLQIALRESLILQSHYAALLNQFDGGNRRGFADPEAWMKRLKETGKIA
jgi:hypothetical protein